MNATTIPITMIAVAAIADSPFNPRRTYRDAGLAELAADIKAQGVLQPLVVRPTADDTVDRFQLVFGHRRLRAARLAGLAEVPCIVGDMTDEEARRAQIGENLQREDVHPIEEAEGFQALIDEHGVTAEQLVADTGKSKSYIYGRLKLLQAVPEVRDACLAGDIGSEVALLIARLRTAALQRDALKRIAADWHAKQALGDGGRSSFRRIREMLAERYTLDLDKAIFPITDASLIPAGFPMAVPCEICPKRSGNAPEYVDLCAQQHAKEPDPADYPKTFEGDCAYDAAVEAYLKHTDDSPFKAYSDRSPGPDICTDPDCFEAKKKAHLARIADELKDEGKTVITGAKARAAIDAHGNLKPDYVPIADAKKALKAAGVKQAPTTVTIVDQRTGKHVFAVERSALKDAGVKVADKPKSHSENYAEQNARWERERKAREEKVKRETQWRTAAWSAVHEAATTAPRHTVELQIAAAALLAIAGRAQTTIVCGAWAAKSEAELAKRIGSMTADECTRLLVDLATADEIDSGYNGVDKTPLLERAAAHHGVDIAAIKAQASAPPPADKPPAKGKKAKAEKVEASASPGRGSSSTGTSASKTAAGRTRTAARC